MSRDAFIPCCEEGLRYAESFLIVLGSRPGPEELARELASWALHAIDVHEAHGMADPGCAGCWLFGKPPRGGLDIHRWWEEGRVHRVAHSLGIENLLAHPEMRGLLEEDPRRDRTAFPREQEESPGSGAAPRG